MDHKESDQASNDATTILSELLSSTEVVHHSQAPTTATLAQDKIEKNLENNSLLKGCDNEDLVNPLKNNEIINMGYTNMDDISKIQQIRHVHIPYILNGELYQIQTQDGENVTVKCCHCPPDRVYRGSVRSTGNFHMHIKRRHPDLLEKLHDMKVNALLERRDRLMRNRKITQRNNRNRPLATVVAAGAAPISSFKSEPTLCTSVTPTTSQLSLTSTPELGLMHTHNLKIKTVFQRHQMQQKEAAEMRNWNNVNYAVMPIAKIPTNESNEEPINYSLKTQENNEETHASSTTSYSNQQQEQQQQQEQSKQQNNIQTTCENYADLSKQPTNSSIATEHNELTYQTNDRNFSTSSISVSCPSVMSSYSSNQHYGMETAYQYNNIHNPHNLSIIKPENLGMESENEVLDLSMHTESGIFLNSTITSDDGINNNSENNDINDNRAGSQLLTTANTTAAVVAGGSNNNNSTCSSNITANNNNNTKWQELLMQVETSLRDVQREMNVRNHIESNRMFLDIAKFKFLHPSFQFNW